MKYRLPGLVLLCWLYAGGLLCVSAQYRIDSWTTDNVLPQNSVNAIVQTRDGYIWFTTNDGLVRFDGVRFKVFNRANLPTLPTNRVTQLKEDQSGRLWVAMEDGNFGFLLNGEFTLVTKPNEMSFKTLDSFQEDGHGSMAIYAEQRNLRYQDGKFVPFEFPGRQEKSVYLATDRDGGIWFYEKGAPMGLHRAINGEVRNYDVLLPHSRAYTKIYEDVHGAFWIINGNEIIFRIRHEQVQSCPLPLKNNWDIAGDQEGNLWIGSYSDGLLRIPANAVTAAELQPESIRVVTAQASVGDYQSPQLCPDREGGMWVGTQKGLKRLLPQTVRVYSKLDGLPEDNIYPVYEDRKGRIWLGAWRQSLMRYHWETFTTVLNDEKIVYYSSLFEDRDGRFWFGTTSDVYYLENEKPVSFTSKLGLERAEFSVITQDQTGRLWFGTNEGLISYADGKAAKYTKADGLPNNNITALWVTPNGALWVGTRGGIALLENGVIKALTEKDGLASNFIRSLYQDTAGVLWIGSYDNGLTRYEKGRFTKYSIKDGLHSNGVFCILEDGQGWFWINSNLGIYRVNKQELNDFAAGSTKFVTSISYDKQDGLLNIEGNGGRQPAGIKARDGRLWFPTAQGVAVVNPQEVRHNNVPPPVLVEEIQIDREAVANSIFQAALCNKDNAITLQPGQGNLEIIYTGLSFINSEQVKFKYRLVGLDDDWIEAGPRRTAYYPYLPSGTYTFRVIAANRDGVWNLEGATIVIRVLPPFYRTWWFISLAGLFLCWALFNAVRYRVERLSRENAAQQEFSRKLIASQENERKRIAAELHDGLGQNLLVIKNRALLALLKENKHKGGMAEQMGEISTMISHTIEEVRQIARDLRPYQLDRLGLTLALQAVVRNLSETPGLECSGKIDDVDDLFAPEAEINLFRVVQECANNIIKHARATRVEIIVERRTNLVKVTIQDNGQGFDPLLEAANPQRGLGLTGLSERARILNAGCDIISAPAQGVTVILRIPIPADDTY